MHIDLVILDQFTPEGEPETALNEDFQSHLLDMVCDYHTYKEDEYLIPGNSAKFKEYLDRVMEKQALIEKQVIETYQSVGLYEDGYVKIPVGERQHALMVLENLATESVYAQLTEALHAYLIRQWTYEFYGADFVDCETGIGWLHLHRYHYVMANRDSYGLVIINIHV